MNDPVRARNMAVLTLLLGGAGLAWGIANYTGPSVLAPILIIVGAIATQLGIVGVFVFAFDARRYSQLKSGKTRIACWTLTPEEWRAFLVEVRSHLQSVPQTTPVEIVVGTNAVFRGNEFLSLHHGIQSVAAPIWVEGPPSYLEFHVSEPGASDSSPSFGVVRIPFGANHRSEARRVYEHYVRVLPPLRSAP